MDPGLSPSSGRPQAGPVGRDDRRTSRRLGDCLPVAGGAILPSSGHGRSAMQIVDSQIHIWENGKMSAHHRQIPTYSMDDALAEMASAGVDAAVIHPPSSLGEAVNTLAVEAVRKHPDKFCILGNFDLQAPNREEIVKNWRT